MMCVVGLRIANLINIQPALNLRIDDSYVTSAHGG